LPTGELSNTTFVIASVIKILIFLGALLTIVAYTVLLERKVVGRIQNRWGPSRVGPFGIWQPLADGLKFILKEDLTPPYVHKFLYIAAPMLALTTALVSISLIPIGGWINIAGVHTPIQITDTNISLLIILGVTSVGVYGITLAGWSSNSKYSMLGALRASSQMISYEVALGLSLVGVLILTGSFNLRDIVDHQAGGFWNWNIFKGGQFIAFFIYLMAAFAETNRIPFDLPEAESELVAGYHTEYSSMKFAMFFMAEYINVIVASAMTVTLFFGGWSLPGFTPHGTLGAILSVAVFVVKTLFFVWVFVWVRWTLPRFRYDQLMKLGWKGLFPIAVVNVVATAVVLAFFGDPSWPQK